MSREEGQAKAAASVLRNIIIELASTMTEEKASDFIAAVELGTQRDLRAGTLSTKTHVQGEAAAGAQEFTSMVFHALDVLSRDRASRRGSR